MSAPSTRAVTVGALALGVTLALPPAPKAEVPALVRDSAGEWTCRMVGRTDTGALAVEAGDDEARLTLSDDEGVFGTIRVVPADGGRGWIALADRFPGAEGPGRVEVWGPGQILLDVSDEGPFGEGNDVLLRDEGDGSLSLLIRTRGGVNASTCRRSWDDDDG